jgi:hypothetical protein
MSPVLSGWGRIGQLYAYLPAFEPALNALRPARLRSLPGICGTPGHPV